MPLAFNRPLLFRSNENASTPTAYARIRTSKDNSYIREARAVIQLFLDAVHGLDAERTQHEDNQTY